MRNGVALVTGLLTEHTKLNAHLHKMGIQSASDCGGCGHTKESSKPFCVSALDTGKHVSALSARPLSVPLTSPPQNNELSIMAARCRRTRIGVLLKSRIAILPD